MAPDTDQEGAVAQVSGISASLSATNTGNLPTPAQSRVGSFEQMMGQGHVLFAPSTPPPGQEDELGGGDEDGVEIMVGQQNELEYR